jgi:hypothetical protein
MRMQGDGWCRYSRTGELLEIIGGKNITGKYGAYSPDRRWIVVEEWYCIDPYCVKLIMAGEEDATLNYFETSYLDLVTADVRDYGHYYCGKYGYASHPKFSRDGKRLYYTKPMPDNTIGLFSAQVPNM